MQSSLENKMAAAEQKPHKGSRGTKEARDMTFSKYSQDMTGNQQ